MSGPAAAGAGPTSETLAGQSLGVRDKPASTLESTGGPPVRVAGRVIVP